MAFTRFTQDNGKCVVFEAKKQPKQEKKHIAIILFVRYLNNIIHCSDTKYCID